MSAGAGAFWSRPHGPRLTCTATIPAASAGTTSLSTRSPTYALVEPASRELPDLLEDAGRASGHRGSPTTRRHPQAAPHRAPSARGSRSGFRRSRPGARLTNRLEARHGVGVESSSSYARPCHQSVGRSIRDGTRLVVLLATPDGHAERGPDDVRLEAGALREDSPPALLVDERLADVEEDGLQRHGRSLQRLAL